MTTTVTSAFAEFVAGVSYASLPRQALATARTAMRDAIANGLAGTQEPSARILLPQLRAAAPAVAGQAGVLGSGFKTSLTDAALANGFLCHIMDLDDYSFSSGLHPTSTLAPALLALGEGERRSGKAVLEAFVAGFEVEYRIGREIAYAIIQRGFHPTPVCGAIGAAAASARLLGLDATRTVMALGIATTGGMGLRANFGRMSKGLGVGNTVRAGLQAALLARDGFGADEDTLGHPLGYLNALVGKEKWDARRLTEGLGERYFLGYDLAMKRYASCGTTFMALDAILDLVHAHHVTADAVAEVIVRTPSTIPITLRYPEPQTGLEAKYSMQYCMAAVLVDGAMRLDHFTDAKARDPNIRMVMERVRFVHPEATGWDRHTAAQEVTLKLRDGRTLSREVAVPKGQPSNPLSEAELVGKYRECAAVALPPEAIEASEKMLADIEGIGDVSELMQTVCMTGAKAKPRPTAGKAAP